MNIKASSQFGVSKKRASSHAFTIVELLVVIVVIGILAAITIVSYTGISSRATVASMQSDLSNASKQLKLFQVENSNYPTTIDCTIPDSTTNKCIKTSNGTSYEYYVDNTADNQSFCVTATKSNSSYSINNNGSTIPTAYCPVLYLDAGNTLSYPGAGTTWTDLSGNGNNGTLVNGVGYSSVNGGALSFDGVNDYVNSGINDSLKLRDRITISAWVLLSRTLAAGELGGIVDNTPTPGAFNYILTVVGSNRISCSFQNTGYTQLTSPESIGLNTWHHVAMTVDDNNIDLYIDGINKISAPKTTSTFSWNNTYIGNWRSNGYYFPGSMGEVSIYNRALSSEEISQRFDALKDRYGL